MAKNEDKLRQELAKLTAPELVDRVVKIEIAFERYEWAITEGLEGVAEVMQKLLPSIWTRQKLVDLQIEQDCSSRRNRREKYS